MSIILAIEPDAGQAESLRQVLRGRFGAELLVVKTKDQAVAAVNREVPDLVLVSALLSPRDEDLLIAHLRTIEEASHLQPLRIPQLRRHEPAPAKGSRFGFGKKKPAPPPTGCDPADFAEEVASYLACAREIRKRPRTAAAAAMTTPAPAYDPWPSAARPQEPLRDSDPDVRFSEPVPSALADDPVAQEIDRLIQNLDAPGAADALLALEPAIESLGEQLIKAAPGPDPFQARSADETRPAEKDAARALEEAAQRAAEDDAARRAAEEEEAARRAAADEAARLVAEEQARRLAEEEARRAAEEEARRAAEEEARKAAEAARLAAELERLQAEAEARKAAEEARMAAELERVQAEAAERRAAEMAQLQAEADALRESTQRAREEVELQAREALAAELAQVRAEAERQRQAELVRLQAEADERADAAARKAREAAEAEAARAFAEELTRVRTEAEATAARALEQEMARARAEAEAAATRALGDEVARVRDEAQARLEAEMERVRAETERARHAELSEANARAEKLRESAAREARAAAEAAARNALESEIQRVRAEADERLASELAQLRAEAERRRQHEIEQVRRQVDEMREAAAQQARAAAAEALQAEMARAQEQAQAAARAQAAAQAAAAQAAAHAAAQAAAAQAAAPRPPTIVRAPKSDTSAPRLAGTPALRLAQPPPPPPAPPPAPAATQSSSYYDLWRNENARDAPDAPADAPRRDGSFFRKNRWALPAAASLLIVVGAAMSVDGSAWRARAQRALAGDPAEPAASPEPAPGGAAKAATGTLLVESTPPGARVLIDGSFRGVTPLTLEDLAAGRHRVVLESSAGVVRRQVTIRAGERTITSEAMINGWLEVFSRIPVEIHVNGRRVGTSGEGQITMPAGQHTITLRNLRFNYRDTQTLVVEPGKTTAHSVTLPTGRVTVTEPGGADVWIEGQRVGQTPLHDAPVPIGTREIVLRHPDAGERRYTAEVRYGETTQVGPRTTAPPADPSQLLPLSRKPSGQ